jgi:hypothetical protein
MIVSFVCEFVFGFRSVLIGPNRRVLGRPVKHDDVLVVPEFFCQEDDWFVHHVCCLDLNSQYHIFLFDRAMSSFFFSPSQVNLLSVD